MSEPTPETTTPALVTGHVTAHVTSTEGPMPVSVRAAEFGAWTTYFFAGSDRPFQLLRRDPQRSRAVLYAGAAAVFLGSQAQMQQNAALGFPSMAPALGFKLTAGFALTYTAQDEVWVCPTTTAASVAVLVERWDEAA